MLQHKIQEAEMIAETLIDQSSLEKDEKARKDQRCLKFKIFEVCKMIYEE